MTHRPFWLTATTIALLGATLVPLLHSEPLAETKATMALAREVATQQSAILENQTKIDARLAEIAEDVRLARIFVSRGGGKK